MDVPTYVDIQTKEFITVQTANKIAIYVLQVELFNSANVHVHFLNEQGQNVNLQVLLMEGADYLAWGDDDQYVVNWTLDKLGLNRSTQVVIGTA
jgi:hypothetical protein